MADRVVSPKPNEEEGKFELSLRPKRLTEYIGQDKVKQNLDILLKAAPRPERLLPKLLMSPLTLTMVEWNALASAAIATVSLPRSAIHFYLRP